MRRPAPAAALAIALVVAAAFTAAAPLAAQDTTRVAPDSTRAAPDTARPAGPPAAPAAAATPAAAPGRGHPSPTGALVRSLLVPGWGQLYVHRPLTAGLFVGLEAVTLGFALKYNHELRQARQAGDSAAIQDKTNKREDWLVYMGVNHLLAGLEAYVSAHLADFPRDLELRAVPGGVAGRVALPLRLR
ncbi:MAG TPA: hypothetical protein VFS40_02045 [Gemmatimonadales bacterium]|nr:hypothetical protein [Gemmatimonadales bacterium]